MDDPSSRNEELDCKFKVRVYFKTGREVTFPARDISNARDIAARCVKEFVWIANEDTEEFFPPNEIHKAKIEKIDGDSR